MRRVQRESAGEQDWAEVGDLSTHGHTRELRIRATQAQQLDRELGRGPVLTVGRGAAQELLGADAGLGQARQVSLDVAQEDGGAVRGQALGQELEGTGLARARRAGDQEVAVEHGQRHLGGHAGHARATIDERADRDSGDVPGVGALDLGGESRQFAARGGGRGRGSCGCFGGGRACGRGASCFKLETQGLGLRSGRLCLGGLRCSFRRGELRLEILNALAHCVAFRLWARCAAVLRRYRNSIPWDCGPMRVMRGGTGVGFVHNPCAHVAVIHRGPFSAFLWLLAGASVRA